MTSWIILILGCWFASHPTSAAQAGKPKVKHAPELPRSGETVRITSQGLMPTAGGELILQYQLVEPGSYVALKDAAYKSNWISVPMRDDGSAGDALKGDGVYTVQLPASTQISRRLVRYRIADGGSKKVLAPLADDTQPNFAYFVYDGVPAWHGAVNPSDNDPKRREKITFGTNVMRSVQPYFFISKKDSVENVTWFQPTDLGDPRRKEYAHTGTMVVDGKVHDHIRFRARGGQWRHSMGKNMWKFDFNRGHHLQARDDHGREYRAKWEKLNLGACIQQGTHGRRGEQGLFESVGYRLFNLAGVEAPRTHFVQLRIITEVEETPSDQYKGDFWGLYLAVENEDEDFLKEHNLPDGNIYKWDFGQPKLNHQGAKSAKDGRDIQEFVLGYQTGRATEAWWRQNFDLDRYYSYRSILECIHHYDVYAGKNYFYYLNPETRLWSVLPWDIDLTWADDMHGTGREPFHRAGLTLRPPFSIAYQNRLLEIRDLLYNPEQTDALIDEYASFIGNPNSVGFVDADRAKWDYHPIMASRFVHPSRAGQGRFYQAAPEENFQGMIGLMKSYVRQRGPWIDSVLLKGAIPPTPTMVAGQPLDFSKDSLQFQASLPNDVQGTMEWRLAEVNLRPSSPRVSPKKYEIEALWQSSGDASGTVPVKLLENGRVYRVRARVKDANGRCSHWSTPVEFTARR